MKSEETIKKLQVYEGKEPYVFVSYSHKDTDYVLPLIESLKKIGCRVWFDAGLAVGVEWMNTIAEHLEECSAFLFVMTDDSAESPYCLDEVAFARTNDKPSCVISVSPDMKVPDGLGLMISRFSSVRAYEYADYDALLSAIRDTGILDGCFGTAIPEDEGQSRSVSSYGKRKSSAIAIAGLFAAFGLGFAISCLTLSNGVLRRTGPAVSDTAPVSSDAADSSSTGTPESERRPTEMTDGLEFEIYGDSSCAVTGYSGTEKDVIVPSLYKKRTVIQVSIDGADIESIVLPDTANYIALSNIPSLGELNIPEQTAHVTVHDMEKLRRINFGQAATDIHIENCALLEELSLPESTEALSLNNCKNLIELHIPDALTNESIVNCPALKSVDIAPNVEQLSLVGFPLVTSLMIPNSVTDLELSGFPFLKSLIMPRSVAYLWLTDVPAGIITLPEVSEQLSLENMDVPNLILPAGTKTVRLSSIRSLKTLSVPEGVSCVNVVDIESLQELHCSASVKEIRLDYLDNLSVLSFHDGVEVFWYNSLENNKFLNYTVIDGVKYLGTDTNPIYVLVDGQSAVGDIVVPDGVHLIGGGAFRNSEISSIKLPDSITGIGGSAFESCNQLTEFSFPKNIEIISFRILWSCESLKKVVLPGGSAEISDFDLRCQNIEEIVFDGEHDDYYSEGDYIYDKKPSVKLRYNYKTGVYEPLQ